MKHFPGIEDDEFIRGKVPMTKKEVRILALSAARIDTYDLVCDIGAGTGSLSIEAALLAEKGMVYAIERNPEAIKLLRENKEKFEVMNLAVIQNEAPKGMEKLPERLDAALVGGSGKELPAILADLAARIKPGGRIVLTCITVQTLMETIEFFRAREDFTYTAAEVQVTQLKQVGRYDMKAAQNPITIVTAVKDEEAAPETDREDAEA
ncbi:hypothetical protein TAMA11512_14930 [Selenomonas sp. TAMA-11512]|uniref:precorrin-6Y C5,15-methyltransferase (decarboxylating) subunit CbiT n=1 Tax=Selenomonas sp. TAMA-11512 TaxID=3095337 RepID=UPI003088C1BC|nr:hypothetical protein TAMA11512_14930 [Selenomonas sp. TAMA-11512]